MAECTLENTWPLLDEIRKRMGEAWEPEPTAEQVESEWRARGGVSFSVADLLGGSKTASDVLKVLGHAPRFEEIRAELLRQRETRMHAARAKAEASLRRDLRMGLWVALVQGSDGLSPQIASQLWDGTQADNWLRDGHQQGELLRVYCAEEQVHPPPEPRDHGEKAAISWLEENYLKRDPSDKSKQRCKEAAKTAIPSLGEEAFKRAWTAVSKKHPDWRMSKSGPKK
jgi:hypothetical protein